MKKILFSLAILAIFCVIPSMGQYNFVIQNGSSASFKTLEAAYEAAVAGDTVYMPGGSFNMPSSIDKGLIWIGVGYHPDSTEATYFTRINNQATLTGNCDNSYFTGIHFASNVVMGENGDDAMDVEFSRCRVTGSITLRYNNSVETDINTRFSECILEGNLDANLGANIHIEKSIVKVGFQDFRSSVFDRVILLSGNRNSSWGYSYAFNHTQNSLIKNSFFYYNTYGYWKVDVYDNINNNFLNNIFAGIATFPEGTNTGSNNITSINPDDLFENIDVSISAFSYQHDFHLKPGSAGVGAGTDGNDIGIYGGSMPFKVGGLPAFPHIRNINIGTETTNGILHVEIEATAQDK